MRESERERMRESLRERERERERERGGGRDGEINHNNHYCQYFLLNIVVRERVREKE